MTDHGFEGQLWARDAAQLGDVEGTPVLRRFDRKQLLRADAADRFIASLPDDYRVLQVDGRRLIGYSTTYLDTPDLAAFHAHRQGRRRRYKIRTRHYGDPAGTMLEVKATGPQGRTLKYRRWRGHRPIDRLSDDDRDFVTRSVASSFGAQPRLDLRYCLETRFRRCTLLDPVTDDRITIDVGLEVVDGDRTVTFGDDWVIVEIKSRGTHPLAAAAIARSGARTHPISKYCLAVGALHPQLPANRWKRAAALLGTNDRRPPPVTSGH